MKALGIPHLGFALKHCTVSMRTLATGETYPELAVRTLFSSFLSGAHEFAVAFSNVIRVLGRMV